MLESTYEVKRLPIQGSVKVGDYLQSESIGSFPVKVIEITEKGDFVTDELDLADPMGSCYVIARNSAIKLGPLMLCKQGEVIGPIPDQITWLRHGQPLNNEDVIVEPMYERYSNPPVFMSNYIRIKGPCGHFH